MILPLSLAIVGEAFFVDLLIDIPFLLHICFHILHSLEYRYCGVGHDAIAVIANRINPLGVTEPNIERRGTNQIVVELPRLSVTDKQKDRIGRTALLEFHELVPGDSGEEKWVPTTATINGQEKALTSSYFNENTVVTTDDFGRVVLVFEWNEEDINNA